MNENEKSTSVNEEPTFINQEMTVWNWLVIIGTSLGSIISGIIPHSFGTFIAHFKSDNNKTNNPSFYFVSQFEWNWLPALSSAVPCILLPLFVLIIQKINRSYQMLSALGFVIIAISCGLSSLVSLWYVFFFTYSLLYSIGSSLFLAVVVIILAEYFPVNHRFHVLATSLFQIGYPAAALIGNPLLAILIINYGWQVALKFTAFFEVITGVIIALLMKPVRDKSFCKHSEGSSENCPIKAELFSSTQRTLSATSMHYLAYSLELWTWLIAKFLNYLCWYGLRTNLVTYLVKSTNFGLEKSATLMSIYAGAEVIVAMSASIIGNGFKGYLMHIHVFSSMALAVLTGLYTIAITSYLSAVIVMICIGAAVQSSLNFGYPASVEVVKAKFDMKTGWILTNVAAGFGIFISPLFSGILMDRFNVKALFYAQSCGWALQAFLYLITLLIIKSNQNKLPTDYIEVK
uniref:Slc16a-7 n=1 Tax=Schmidtea mediterranea TaxID=79327 RepID=A0A0H3YF94_SCHMD|nr:slc16a-7 [Schmidtea mediterranea]